MNSAFAFRARRASPHLRVGGFTLVEVLIAFVLLSMIALALTSAVRAIGQAQERVDVRLERWDEERTAVGFIQTVMQRMVERRRTPLSESDSQLYFSGQPDGVMWMGIMPANYGTGGRTLFRLTVESTSGAGVRSLVLRWHPWSGETGFPDWQHAESRALVHGVRSLSVKYVNADQTGAVLDTWPVKDKLPQRIELWLGMDAGAWPPIVVPIYRLGNQGSTSPDGFSFGGSQ